MFALRGKNIERVQENYAMKNFVFCLLVIFPICLEG
jgi:hypothetical protein